NGSKEGPLEEAVHLLLGLREAVVDGEGHPSSYRADFLALAFWGLQQGRVLHDPPYLKQRCSN
ncbi:hypothetical protein DXG01_004292, partial [Tephrocybe rancida]